MKKDEGTHVVPVVGATFVDDYPDNIYRLRELWDRSTYTHDGLPLTIPEPMPVILVRNPDNEHDANAVEVHVPSGVGMIGHCSRIIAARLAPSMDAGIEFQAWIHRIRVDPDHPENPGIDIAFKRAEQETSA